MKRLRRYEEFLKLNESGYNSIQTGMNPSTSFGLTDLSTINTGGATEPKDPNLSFDAWDKHKANLRDEFKRMGEILKSVFTQTQVSVGKEFEDNIEDLSIVKIFRNNNGSLDVYIKFFFMEQLFYATFTNWGSYNGATFKSSITQIPELAYRREDILRIIGLIKETLNVWFQPSEDDTYRAIREVKVYNEMGEIFMLPIGAKIIVEDVITQDKQPIIYLSYNDKSYTLTGLDYYFFHWWFKSEEKKEFYL